jgi:hypothetical protein
MQSATVLHAIDQQLMAVRNLPDGRQVDKPFLIKDELDTT